MDNTMADSSQGGSPTSIVVRNSSVGTISETPQTSYTTTYTVEETGSIIAPNLNFFTTISTTLEGATTSTAIAYPKVYVYPVLGSQVAANSVGSATTFRIATSSSSAATISTNTGTVSSSTTTSVTQAGAVSPSNTSSAASSPRASNSGSDAGKIAGAAVGSAIGAALLAFLVAFFIFRRKRNPDRGAVYMNEKSGRGHPWEVFLPQSADDNTIKAAVSSLYSQIEMHVENFYGVNTTGTISAESRAGLAKLDSGMLPKPVDQLLVGAAPLPALKHIYAWTILNRLSPSKNGEDSLLPAEFARAPLPQAASKHNSSNDSEALLQAYDYWRVLTAHLLYPQSSKTTAAKQNIRSDGEAISDMLLTTFEPWLKSADAEAKAEEHLRNVLHTATETGLLIMSQRSSFGFEWDVLGKSRGAPAFAKNDIVITPAFEKTADEHGEALSRHQLLLKARVETAVL